MAHFIHWIIYIYIYIKSKENNVLSYDYITDAWKYDVIMMIAKMYNITVKDNNRYS